MNFEEESRARQMSRRSRPVLPDRRTLRSPTRPDNIPDIDEDQELPTSSTKPWSYKSYESKKRSFSPSKPCLQEKKKRMWSPPPPRRSFKQPERSNPVLHDLMKGLQDGLFCDVEFIVDRQIIPAHKAILVMRSNIFSIMFNSRWDVNDGVMQIKVQNYDVQAFKTFLKCLYTDDDIDNELDIDIVLEVLSLALMYEIRSIVSKCEKCLRLRMIYNSTMIFDATRYSDNVVSQLNRDALMITKVNISELLRNDDFLGVIDDKGLYKKEPWSADLWNRILEPADEMDLFVEEIALFRSLLKWSNIGEFQKRSLSSLINLVRFPLIKYSDFLVEVVPSGLLLKSDIEALNSFLTEANGYEDLRFKWQSRKKTYVQDTSQNLVECLENALPGDVIQLPYDNKGMGLFTGAFTGPFVLETSYVTLLGHPKEPPVLRISDQEDVALRVCGNRCHISGIVVAYTNTSIHRTFNPLLEITGNKNEIVDVHTSVGRIQISGVGGNSFGGPIIQNSCWAIGVTGNDNLIDRVHSIRRGNIVLVEGNYNTISNITHQEKKPWIRTEELSFNMAVRINKGEGHVIHNFMNNNCKDWHIECGYGSKSATIRNCYVNYIALNGVGHFLENVFASESLKVFGKNHNFKFCESPIWKSSSGTSVTLS